MAASNHLVESSPSTAAAAGCDGFVFWPPGFVAARIGSWPPSGPNKVTSDSWMPSGFLDGMNRSPVKTKRKAVPIAACATPRAARSAPIKTSKAREGLMASRILQLTRRSRAPWKYTLLRGKLRSRGRSACVVPEVPVPSSHFFFAILGLGTARTTDIAPRKRTHGCLLRDVRWSIRSACRERARQRSTAPSAAARPLGACWLHARLDRRACLCHCPCFGRAAGSGHPPHSERR